MRDRRIVPYRLPLKTASRTLRRDPTPAERKLWYQFLKYLPQKVMRQKPLGAHITDFYRSARRRVIEIDGASHFSASGEQHDAARTEALAKLELRVIRFTNAEVMEQFEAVCERIEQAPAES